MDEMQVFNNPAFGEIRTVSISNEPWFVGKDVAQVLGYERPAKAIQDRVDADDALKWGLSDSIGRNQETTIINESGLYALILASKLPNARRFKHWITSEVLPSVRKYGVYATNSALKKFLDNPELIMELGAVMLRERDRANALSDELKIARPKAEYTGTCGDIPPDRTFRISVFFLQSAGISKNYRP